MKPFFVCRYISHLLKEIQPAHLTLTLTVLCAGRLAPLLCLDLPVELGLSKCGEEVFNKSSDRSRHDFAINFAPKSES